MSTLLGTRAGVKSVKFWQLSSCWFIFRWWLFLRVCPLGAQQFFKTRVVMSAAMTMMRETVMVMI